jgi:hypothetical protein
MTMGVLHDDDDDDDVLRTISAHGVKYENYNCVQRYERTFKPVIL